MSGIPIVDSPESLPPDGDAFRRSAGAGHRRGGTSLQAARWRAGPGSQNSRFSPLRPLPGSARTSLCLSFLICPVSLSGGADGLTPRVSGRGLPSGTGQGKWDGPWLSWSSVQTRGPVWTWAPSAHRPALCLRLPLLLLGGLQVASLRAQVKSETQGSDHRHPSGMSVCKRVHEHE